LKLFLEIELEKIPWFKDLSVSTKNELIYSMEHEERQAGSMLCQRGQKADKMFLVQSGTIDCVTSYDRRALPFILERLEVGAIINHRSFMVNDVVDTDYKCKSKVTIFTLSFTAVQSVMNKRADLARVFHDIEREVLLMKNEIALDYIFNNQNYKQYEDQLRKNELRVQLKNAIMQSWNELKEKNKPPSL
jgi:CRP-like cAMP-binding protein